MTSAPSPPCDVWASSAPIQPSRKRKSAGSTITRSALAARAAAALGEPCDPAHYETIRDLARLDAWIAVAMDNGVLALDLQASGIDPMQVDLIGLSVESVVGEPLGVVQAVQDFGAGDLLEIQPPAAGPTWWLPFTREAVPEVRLAEGKIIAAPPGEAE